MSIWLQSGTCFPFSSPNQETIQDNIVLIESTPLPRESFILMFFVLNLRPVLCWVFEQILRMSRARSWFWLVKKLLFQLWVVGHVSKSEQTAWEWWSFLIKVSKRLQSGESRRHEAAPVQGLGNTTFPQRGNESWNKTAYLARMAHATGKGRRINRLPPHAANFCPNGCFCRFRPNRLFVQTLRAKTQKTQIKSKKELKKKQLKKNKKRYLGP